MESNQRTKMVYTIVENARGGRAFWTKIGIGFVNRDGSINLRLDALPVNGTIQVRDYEPRDERTGAPLANETTIEAPSSLLA